MSSTPPTDQPISRSAAPAAGASGPPAGTAGPSWRALRARMIQVLVQYLLFAVLLLVAAGRPDWSNAWLFVGLCLLLVLANAWYLLPRNPEVIVERGRGHQGTRRFDRALMGGYSVMYLGMLVLAGLDGGRFGWAALGWPWVLAGTLLLVAGMVPVAGAMAVNRNLETTVRLQLERGHTVATTGPYRWVRHPMYLGMLLHLPATALVLGSAWALLPAAGCAALLVVRTALEDRMLCGELPGYARYAATTRHRLVPRVW